MRSSNRARITASITALLGVCAQLAAFAVHETGVNRLTFAPAAGSPAVNASGFGTWVLYRGSLEAGTDQWALSDRFRGLRPNTRYSVVVRGKTTSPPGMPGGDFEEVYSFVTAPDGTARIPLVFRRLNNLGVVQVRVGGPGGTPILQATRAAGGPGAIITIPFNP
jgi:hypothetical protein